MSKIAKFGSWFDIFKKNSELESLMGFDDGVIDSAGRAYLKRKAIDTCINFVGRTISQSEFRLKEDREILKTDDWSYKLNVRPNTDQSAADFWQKVIYKLLYDNEVLIVLSDSNDLLIADSFVRTEYALYDDRFDSVVVKDYMFDRAFFMDEVIYLNYNNESLENYIAGLFGDYGELFGRMIDSSMRNNQIRGTVEVSSMQGTTEEKNKTLQDYVDRIFKGFKKAVAIVPITKGLEYKEVSGGTNKNSGQSFEEIDKLQKSALNEVAKLIGIPPSLVQGEMANQDSAQETYINFCINPLLKKLEDELNAKVLSKRQFKRGKYFEVVNTNRPKPVKDIVEDSSNIDKLLASGVVNRNFVRSLYGLEPVNSGDEYYVTKNYEQEMKGGDAENEEAEN